MADLRNINTPYKILDHAGIEYTVCHDFDHISRYKGLRQVIHSPTALDERFIALETCNPFQTHTEISYYTVPSYEENRLDVIAYKFLGDSSYSWVLAYFNNIEDGFTVKQGQTLKVPANFTALFNTGEVLQSVSPLALNLGSE